MLLKRTWILEFRILLCFSAFVFGIPTRNLESGGWLCLNLAFPNTVFWKWSSIEKDLACDDRTGALKPVFHWLVHTLAKPKKPAHRSIGKQEFLFVGISASGNLVSLNTYSTWASPKAFPIPFSIQIPFASVAGTYFSAYMTTEHHHACNTPATPKAMTREKFFLLSLAGYSLTSSTTLIVSQMSRMSHTAET